MVCHRLMSGRPLAKGPGNKRSRAAAFDEHRLDKPESSTCPKHQKTPERIGFLPVPEVMDGQDAARLSISATRTSRPVVEQMISEGTQNSSGSA